MLLWVFSKSEMHMNTRVLQNLFLLFPDTSPMSGGGAVLDSPVISLPKNLKSQVSDSHAHHFDFKASLVYIGSFIKARAT